jgi:hypothetical protein
MMANALREHLEFSFAVHFVPMATCPSEKITVFTGLPIFAGMEVVHDISLESLLTVSSIKTTLQVSDLKVSVTTNNE